MGSDLKLMEPSKPCGTSSMMQARNRSQLHKACGDDGARGVHKATGCVILCRAQCRARFAYSHAC